MKKIKTFLAFAIAISMCVSTAACGKTNGGEKDDTEEKVTTTTAAAEESEEEEATTTTTAATTTTAETTAEPEPEPVAEDNSAYEYYEDLNAEFQAHGKTLPGLRSSSYTVGRLLFVNSSDISSESAPYYRNGKVYFLMGDYDKFKLYSYDLSTKKLSERSLDSSFNADDIHIYDGKLWNGSVSNCKVIDLDDESADYSAEYSNSSGNSDYDFDVLPNGDLLTYSQENGLFYYSQKDGEVKYPALTLPDSHGLEQEVLADFIGIYGNKAYFSATADYSSYQLYYFDLDKKDWNELPVFAENLSGACRIGKYLIFGEQKEDYSYEEYLFNMETDELIGTFDLETELHGGMPDYFGGDTHIFLNGYKQEEFYKLKCPSDGSKIDENTIETLYSVDIDMNSGVYVCPVNETYYMYIDKAGVFLRTYENGADEEEIVYVFDK